MPKATRARPPPFPWTDEHIANLRGLITTDLSLKDIVEALNERFPGLKFTKDIVFHKRQKLLAGPTGAHTVPHRIEMTADAKNDALKWAHEGYRYRDIREKLEERHGVVKSETAIAEGLKKMGFPGTKTYVRPWGDEMNSCLVGLYGQKPPLSQGEMAGKLQARFGLPFNGVMVKEQILRLKARRQL
jgi:hypothetical protein